MWWTNLRLTLKSVTTLSCWFRRGFPLRIFSVRIRSSSTFFSASYRKKYLKNNRHAKNKPNTWQVFTYPNKWTWFYIRMVLAEFVNKNRCSQSPKNNKLKMFLPLFIYTTIEQGYLFLFNSRGLPLQQCYLELPLWKTTDFN